MSGIGNPSAFESSLKSNGMNVVDHIEFDDHHVYLKKDLDIMRHCLNNNPGSVIITTEKDAVKISSSQQLEQPLRERIFYASIKVSVNAFDGTDMITYLQNNIKNAKKGNFIRG